MDTNSNKNNLNNSTKTDLTLLKNAAAKKINKAKIAKQSAKAAKENYETLKKEYLIKKAEVLKIKEAVKQSSSAQDIQKLRETYNIKKDEYLKLKEDLLAQKSEVEKSIAEAKFALDEAKEVKALYEDEAERVKQQEKLDLIVEESSKSTDEEYDNIRFETDDENNGAQNYNDSELEDDKKYEKVNEFEGEETDEEIDDEPFKKGKKSKKTKVKRKLPISTKILITLDIIMVICFFLAYGPISYFRVTYITTAMKTMTHRYFANIFYSQKTIDRVVDENKTIETTENTDASAIKITEVTDTGNYASVYEEQILKKENPDDIYKVIEIEGSTWEGHVVVVYDPSKISLAVSSKMSSGGQLTSQMAEENDAIIAVNGGGFSRSGSVLKPKGNLIQNGKILYNTGKKSRLIGFNNDNILVLSRQTAKDAQKNGMRDGVEFGPFLIVNGKASTFKGDGGYGKRSRSAIGQRQDGIVLFIVIDGKTLGSGISMPDLTELFVRYKAYNAANLDGGGSSTLVINGKLINNPAGWNYRGERYVPDAWIVK